MRHHLTFLIFLLSSFLASGQTNEALFPGDSLSLYPDPTNNFPFYLSQNLPPQCGISNVALAGNTINQRLADLGISGGLYDNVNLSCQNIVINWYCGHNDLKNGSNATDVWRDYTNFQYTVQAHFPTHQFRFIYHTIHVGSDITGGMETERLSFNSTVRSLWQSAGAYALVDLATNQYLSNYITYATNFLGDQIHLTAAGNQDVTNQDFGIFTMALTNIPPFQLLNAQTMYFGTAHLP